MHASPESTATIRSFFARHRAVRADPLTGLPMRTPRSIEETEATGEPLTDDEREASEEDARVAAHEAMVEAARGREMEEAMLREEMDQ